MTALLWFLVALALLALEWLGVEFDGLLAAALAALLVSLLCAWLPLNLGLQLLLFAAGSLALLVLLQRWSARKRERAIRQSDAAQYAEVISGFDAGSDQGRVLWHGQSWAAENLEPGQALKSGSQVLVMGRTAPTCRCCRTPRFQTKRNRHPCSCGSAMATTSTGWCRVGR